MHITIVDAMTLGTGRRNLTRDFIGAGPRAVAASVISSGHGCTLVRGEDALENPRGTFAASDACLVSGMTMDYPSVLAIGQAWKGINPRKPVVAGGPVALEPRRLLGGKPFDAVVLGEGDRIIHDWLEHRASLSTDPSSFASGMLARGSPDASLSLDMPPLAFIEAYDPQVGILSSYPNYWAARVYIECTRGCSNFLRARIGADGRETCEACGYCDEMHELKVDFSCPAGTSPGCGFCSTASVSGPLRSFSSRHVVAQVGAAIAIGCHRVVLGGSDFLDYQREKMMSHGCMSPAIPPPPNHDALHELVDALASFKDVKAGNVQLFVENVKATTCDDESIKILSRIPNVSVSIGVETGLDAHLRAIGKATTVSSIKQAVGLFNKYNVRYHAYFIHSLPGQSRETVDGSVALMAWLEQHGVEKITLYKFKPLPFSAFACAVQRDAPVKGARRLVRAASRINEGRKQAYMHKEVRVLVAETDFRETGAVIAYMLDGGPKVKLKNSAGLLDDKRVHVARVTGVISDKVLQGELVG